MKRSRRLLRELARRKVIQSVGGYLAIIWLAAQGFADLFPAFGLPDWTVRAFVIGSLALTPVVFALSWRYNLTLHGFVRDSEDAGDGYGEDDTSVPGFVSLSWEDPSGQLHNQQFFRPVVLGRDPSCDVHVSDRRVSRRHTEIRGRNGRWYVVDLGSVNGTWIEGIRVTESPLPPRGILRLDRHGPAIRFVVESDESTLVSSDDSTLARYQEETPNHE